jgi:energy-coupling factor transport system permease protein
MHTLAWFTWAAGLMVIALTTRNPLYLSLMLLVTSVVTASMPRYTPRHGISIARFAAIVIPISALLNGLTVHLGDTVLFTIPGSLPVFSGVVTLEALVYGAINGLMLTTVLSIFNTLNIAVAPHAWMRYAPRAYQSIGIAMSIALSFAPQVSRRLRDVREAQAIRGHRIEGVRDWLPLWMPLLMGGLEQSMQLSEAMVARGFGAANAAASPTSRQWVIVGGLIVVLIGWLSQFFAPQLHWVGVALIIAGAMMILAALLRKGRTASRTSYREQALTGRDAMCIALCLGATALALLPSFLGADSSLFYYPYPVPPCHNSMSSSARRC